MTKAKTMIAFFLFLAGFLFVGESHTFFLENFQDRYVQVAYYLETGDSEDEMRQTILDKAEKYEAEAFTIQKENGGAFSRTITIYGNEAVQQNLKSDWGIEQGTISSFFSGKTTFVFKPYAETTEKELQNVWYIGQTAEHLFPMVYPEMVEYSGSIQNSPMLDVSEKVVAALWFMLIITTLLLTYYDIVYSKKEQHIRIILGADSNRIMIQKFIADTVGFSIAALAAVVLLLPFTNSLFRWNVSFIGFLILIFSNGLIIALGMRIGKHLQIKSVASSVKALRISLVIKGAIAILTAIVLSVTILLLVEGIKLYQQKDYYSTNSNRVHIDIDYPYDYEKMEFGDGFFENTPLLSTDDQVRDNFMRYGYRELGLSLVSYQSHAEVSPKWGDKYTFANLSGLVPHKDQIPKWDFLNQNEGNYILVPEGANQSEIANEVLEVGNILGLDTDNLAGVFTYQEGLSVIAEGHNEELEYSYEIKNPIILLDTYDYGALPVYPVTYELREADHPNGFIAYNFAYLMQFTTLEHKPEKIVEFSHLISGEAIKSPLVEFTVIHVENWFAGLWSLQNRSLLIAVILTVLVLILEVQISILALRMAYESNARELTIKKVMGFSLFERFKNFFLLTSILCGLSFVGALVCASILNIGMINYLAWGSILVFLLDIGILLYLTRKNDCLQIQKVLKGGI